MITRNKWLRIFSFSFDAVMRNLREIILSRSQGDSEVYSSSDLSKPGSLLLARSRFDYRCVLHRSSLFPPYYIINWFRCVGGVRALLWLNPPGPLAMLSSCFAGLRRHERIELGFSVLTSHRIVLTFSGQRFLIGNGSMPVSYGLQKELSTEGQRFFKTGSLQLFDLYFAFSNCKLLFLYLTPIILFLMNWFFLVLIFRSSSFDFTYVIQSICHVREMIKKSTSLKTKP